MAEISDDSIGIDRFGEAHEAHFDRALREIKNGSKKTDWMWFVFPQIQGLGGSRNARIYAVQSIEMATELLRHEQFCRHLDQIVQEVRVQLNVSDRTIKSLMGSPDDQKLVSSLTLFAEVASRLELSNLVQNSTQILRRSRREGFRTCQATEDFIRADDLGRLPEFIELLESAQLLRRQEKGRHGRKESWNRYYGRYAPQVQRLLGI